MYASHYNTYSNLFDMVNDESDVYASHYNTNNNLLSDISCTGDSDMYASH